MAKGNLWAFDKGYDLDFAVAERIVDLLQVAVFGGSEVSTSQAKAANAALLRTPCPFSLWHRLRTKARLNKPHYSMRRAHPMRAISSFVSKENRATAAGNCLGRFTISRPCKAPQTRISRPSLNDRDLRHPRSQLVAGQIDVPKCVPMGRLGEG